MTNLFRKEIKTKRNALQGAATLLITVILLAVMTLIILFAAHYSLMQQKITSNQYRNNQAYEAAEAGLEFAIPYLRINSATIMANKSGGFIQPYSDSNTLNVILANNSQYTIVYTNPIANNYTLINITSTGKSDDGTSTRIISQLVQEGSSFSVKPTYALTTKGTMSLKGSSQVVNTETNTTVQSASTVSISGSATTQISTGIGSSSSGLNSDVQQNNSALANTSTSDLFANYFGVSAAAFKNTVNYSYTAASNTNFSSTLNGKQGVSIWIDQTAGEASISGSTVIGSSTQPVILIVNGDFRLSGSAIIYGIVYVTGGTSSDVDVTGSSQIIGGLITTGDLNIAGSTKITFNSSVLNAAQQAFHYYAKVPGSWKDF